MADITSGSNRRRYKTLVILLPNCALSLKSGLVHLQRPREPESVETVSDDEDAPGPSGQGVGDDFAAKMRARAMDQRQKYATALPAAEVAHSFLHLLEVLAGIYHVHGKAFCKVVSHVFRHVSHVFRYSIFISEGYDVHACHLATSPSSL